MNTRRKTAALFFAAVLIAGTTLAANPARIKFNFNPSWLLHIGDQPGAHNPEFDDTEWKTVHLPAAFNEDEAFAKSIHDLTDTIVWYRKHFKIPSTYKNQKVFIEFEGLRQAAEIWINGREIGLHENGVMAFGLDLTDHLVFGNKENVIALRIDNDWKYKEKATGTGFQWNNNNFNANYGGLTKNVVLHICGKLYQTLPLYSHLGTVGTYVYATDINVRDKTAVLNVESEVKNEQEKAQTFYMKVIVRDNDHNMIREFNSDEITLRPGESCIVKASGNLKALRFWSWGYGYLYNITSSLISGKKTLDLVRTQTGIRKTAFRNGMFYLNERVLHLKGYAQRSSNEWPAVGMSVPPWLSDFSNGLMERGNANLVRWMHVTPWKQDIESCDRVGLLQAMPAGDAESDVEGRSWELRKELMRDAIIYNRNHPSIIFYECGNETISEEHMAEMKAIRDIYDPNGGRAIGSREMLDSKEAEYGGEMLYINKSAGIPMFAHEYCRDEGLRKYWDNYSYPYHRDGEGPLYKNEDASAYNRNQDSFAEEAVRRWHEFWVHRPGTGRRVSAGGVNIIFSDTNTHFRGAENYRRSGEVDAMRIEKEAYYAHKIMWDGWVEVEGNKYSNHIIGHWNYEPGTVKDVLVVSNASAVELFLNGRNLGFGERQHHFLFKFRDVPFEAGSLKALSYDSRGQLAGEPAEIKTTDEAAALRLQYWQHPKGFRADGSDMVLIQVEVVDKNGLRCPLANHLIHFDIEGPAEYKGGIAQGENNYILSRDLPVECGVNRILLRSTTEAGKIVVRANAEGLSVDSLVLNSLEVPVKDGLSTFFPKDELISYLWRGATPGYASFVMSRLPLSIQSAVAGSNPGDVALSFDDNELSRWDARGPAGEVWIDYTLSRSAVLTEACLKLGNFRNTSYHLRILTEQNEVLWEGQTEKTLGYVNLSLNPASPTRNVRIESLSDGDQARLSIVEAEFYTQIPAQGR
ncbi:MAG: Beta-galactosidase large subunit [Bacteroidetes bacterium ADurb.Bin090]|nr:MAG: Beta-galactosidase large subunit [Bacteroidetes bacterium ADurb.Bin090]